MTTVAKLRASRASYSVKLREFIRASAKHPKDLICFFEGHDAVYYSIRIDLTQSNAEWHRINCEGKSNVLKLWKIICTHEVYKLTRTAFFVDADFDETVDNINSKRLYITPCYSVENFYVNSSTAKKILIHEFGFPITKTKDVSLARCLKLFQARLNEFLRLIEALNAWFYLQRQAEKANPGTAKVRAEDLKLNSYFAISTSKVTAGYSISKLESDCKAATHISTESVREERLKYRHVDRSKAFRGKFLSYFACQFFKALRLDVKSGRIGGVNSVKKVVFQSEQSSFLSEFSQYAETPQCLVNFILGLR